MQAADGGADAGAGVPEPSDMGGFVDGGAGDPWSEVRDALDEAVDSGELLGFSFTIRDGSDGPAFFHAGGAYRLDQALPTDSSIKPMTGLLAMTLVRDGVLGLQDRMGDRLGWTGPEADVTVEQLMSFTSGFDGSAPCLSPPPSILDGRLVEPPSRESLVDCAATIRAAGLVVEPGRAFTYGGSHQALLATAVEAATGQDWNALFEARVMEPLALDAQDLRYVNNRVAGSAVATSAGASKVYEALAMDLEVLPRRPGSGSLLSPAQARDFVADRTAFPVDRSDSPWRLVPGADLHFGLGIWLDCPDHDRAPDQCLYVGSGANGSTSWIDVDGGYVASLALFQRSFLGYRDGYDVMKRLVPLIRKALGTEPSSKPSCLAPGDHSRSVTLRGIRHDYRVHVPVQRGTDSALIFQLHGGGSTGRAMDTVSGLSALADQEGFVVVTPEGWAVFPDGPQVWNAGTCCGPVDRAPDHVAALEAMLDAILGEDPCIDSGRVFATGHSNGGMMAYRLACELPDRFAAIAVSGGALMNEELSTDPVQSVFDCDLETPVSLLHVHGREDLCAPYGGGPTGGGVLMPPVEDVVERWRERISCQLASETVQGPVLRTRAECEAGTAVEFIAVDGLGHPWAGSDIYGSPELCGGTTTDAVSTTTELWRFFREQRR